MEARGVCSECQEYGDGWLVSTDKFLCFSCAEQRETAGK